MGIVLPKRASWCKHQNRGQKSNCDAAAIHCCSFLLLLYGFLFKTGECAIAHVAETVRSSTEGTSSQRSVRPPRRKAGSSLIVFWQSKSKVRQPQFPLQKPREIARTLETAKKQLSNSRR